MKLRVEHLDDPVLEFGEGEAATPKEGLRDSGPFSLRLGAAHQREVRLALVGTEASVAATRAFFLLARSGVSSESTNKMLFPDFPGFGQAFRSDLVLDERLNANVDTAELARVLACPPLAAFEGALELFANAISTVASATSARTSSSAAYQTIFLRAAELSTSNSRPNSETQSNVVRRRRLADRHRFSNSTPTAGWQKRSRPRPNSSPGETSVER